MFYSLPVNGWLALPTLALLLLLAPYLTSKNPKAPGPPLARFTTFWMAYRVYRGNFHKENIELHEKYGKVVRTGPKYYSINDPSALKQIYGHGTQFTKGQWYDGWVGDVRMMESNLFAQRDIEIHSGARRRLANLYSMTSLISYEPYVDACMAIFRDKLASFAQSRKTMDLTKWFQYYAYDVIGEITFSKRFGFMAEGKDQFDLIKVVDINLELGFLTGFFRPIILLQWSLAPFLGIPLNDVLTFAMQCVQDIRATLGGGSSKDSVQQPDESGPMGFAAKVLTSEKMNQAGNSDSSLVAVCLANIVAGSDTTSATLCGIFFNLLAHPEAFSKLRAELDAATASGELSDPPTFAEAQKLPYLQAVLKEGMRMHPATGLPFWRVVPKGGATICGMYFPEGANVGINSWVAHRNRDVWGADADVFRPERWLESDEAKLKEMNAMFMPFGLGSRTCIGKNISLLEISKVIPQLVRNYDISLDGDRGKRKELPARNAWFVKQHDFVVDVRLRGKSG